MPVVWRALRRAQLGNPRRVALHQLQQRAGNGLSERLRDEPASTADLPPPRVGWGVPTGAGPAIVSADGHPPEAGEAERFRLHLAPTIIRLRRRRSTERASRMLTELAEFYPVTLRGSSVQVAVDRGRAAEAPLRVATILDDIDPAWEEYFHLPELSAPRY